MRKLLLFLLILLGMNQAIAVEKIGVISDAVLTKETPYSAYYSTPDFLVQDIIDLLGKNSNFEVVPLSQTKTLLSKSHVTQAEMAHLRNIGQGYNINFIFLKKVAKLIDVDKLVVVTSSMELERDFLKPTLWNALNVPGFDVVNPTQRVNVYTALVDCSEERVLWENIYAKDIRNNKMKNLDTTVSGNFEGLMRIKQYSKYISPEIAYNVTNTILPGSMAPSQYATKVEGFVMSANKKVRIGSDKQLSNTGYISDKFDDWEESKAQKREQKMLKKQQEEAQKVFLKEAL